MIICKICGYEYRTSESLIIHLIDNHTSDCIYHLFYTLDKHQQNKIKTELLGYENISKNKE